MQCGVAVNDSAEQSNNGSRLQRRRRASDTQDSIKTSVNSDGEKVKSGESVVN